MNKFCVPLLYYPKAPCVAHTAVPANGRNIDAGGLVFFAKNIRFWFDF